MWLGSLLARLWLDLQDARDRLELWLALKAHRILLTLDNGGDL